MKSSILLVCVLSIFGSSVAVPGGHGGYQGNNQAYVPVSQPQTSHQTYNNQQTYYQPQAQVPQVQSQPQHVTYTQVQKPVVTPAPVQVATQYKPAQQSYNCAQNCNQNNAAQTYNNYKPAQTYNNYQPAQTYNNYKPAQTYNNYKPAQTYQNQANYNVYKPAASTHQNQVANYQYRPAAAKPQYYQQGVNNGRSYGNMYTSAGMVNNGYAPRYGFQKSLTLPFLRTNFGFSAGRSYGSGNNNYGRSYGNYGNGYTKYQGNGWGSNQNQARAYKPRTRLFFAKQIGNRRTTFEYPPGTVRREHVAQRGYGLQFNASRSK